MLKISSLKKHLLFLLPITALSFVAVNCSKKQIEENGLYTVGGTVIGLTASGLILQNNGIDTLIVPADDTEFEFILPVLNNGNYDVTVLTNPAGQECVVTNGSGVATSNITNVIVTCSQQIFSIGGVVLLTNGAAGNITMDNLGTVLIVDLASGTNPFTFSVALDETYNITITNPNGNSCTVTSGPNTNMGIATENISTIEFTCAASG